MKRFRFVGGFGVALLALFVIAATNDRYINGTAIPREKVLVYTTGSQAITAAAVTATSVVNSGVLTQTGAATFSLPPRFASAVTGVTASTGGIQGGNPILLTTSLYSVGTVGTSGDSVTLPTGAALGHTVVVENRAATNSLDVFPGASGAVNNKAADALYPLPAGKALTCYSLTAAAAATNWACVGP